MNKQRQTIEYHHYTGIVRIDLSASDDESVWTNTGEMMEHIQALINLAEMMDKFSLSISRNCPEDEVMK